MRGSTFSVPALLKAEQTMTLFLLQIEKNCVSDLCLHTFERLSEILPGNVRLANDPKTAAWNTFYFSRKAILISNNLCTMCSFR